MTDNKEYLEEILFSEKGKILEFRRDSVRLPNGGLSTREYIRHNGAVGIIPLKKDSRVVMVRQYRYAQGCEVLEIPAGKLDSVDEPHLDAALRELREETGLVPGEIRYIGEYVGSPAISTEIIHLYLALDCDEGETDFDDDEFINGEEYNLSELVSMVMDGKISDGKSAYAILWADKFLQDKK